jgi:hypothetical protein
VAERRRWRFDDELRGARQQAQSVSLERSQQARLDADGQGEPTLVNGTAVQWSSQDLVERR